MKPRKPLVYLVVVLPLIVGGGLLVVSALLLLLAASDGIPVSGVPNSKALIVVLPGLLLWLPMSLLLSNLIIDAISPLRRIAERYSTGFGHPDYARSQRSLIKIAIAAGTICVPLIVYGLVQ